MGSGGYFVMCITHLTQVHILCSFMLMQTVYKLSNLRVARWSKRWSKNLSQCIFNSFALYTLTYIKWAIVHKDHRLRRSWPASLPCSPRWILDETQECAPLTPQHLERRLQTSLYQTDIRLLLCPCAKCGLLKKLVKIRFQSGNAFTFAAYFLILNSV